MSKVLLSNYLQEVVTKTQQVVEILAQADFDEIKLSKDAYATLEAYRKQLVEIRKSLSAFEGQRIVNVDDKDIDFLGRVSDLLQAVKA